MSKPSVGEYAAAIFVGPWWGLDPWSVPSWPVANDLSAADRMAVVRTTRRGANIRHARLAPAVIDYSAAVRSDRRGLLWQLPSLLAGFAFFALFVHFVGGVSVVGSLVAGLVLAVFVVAGIVVWGRKAALANAARAQRWARQLLGQSSAEA
jgi:hypothetical protein